MASRPPPGRRPPPVSSDFEPDAVERTDISAAPVFEDDDDDPTPPPAGIRFPKDRADTEPSGRALPRRIVEPPPARSAPRGARPASPPRLKLPVPEAPTRDEPRPKLVLPKPGAATKSAAQAPKIVAGGSAGSAMPAPSAPTPKRPRVRTVDPAVFARQRRAPQTGRYMLLASVTLACAIAGIFVWGARKRPSATHDTVRLQPPIAAQLEAGQVFFSDLDAYRAQHPELEVGSPRYTRIEPRSHASFRERKVQPPQRMSRPERYWTRERIEALKDEKNPTFGFEAEPLPPNQPKYDDYDPALFTTLLMVFTKPPNMTVEVDGVVAGASPLVRVLPPETATVRVKVSAPGFKTREETVRKDKDGAFRLGLVMELLPEDRSRAQKPRPR